MTEKIFVLNKQTISIIQEIGEHVPGGFFIYKAEKPEELLYANKVCFDIFGCKNLEEFKELTGYTFKGMVYPEDYGVVFSSISKQIDADENDMDHVEYRIIRKDGEIRWIEDFGHYCETKEYGGIYTVFISDITEKRMKSEEDIAYRNAVISTLTNAYNTVWLIDDVVTESNTLYHTDNHEIHKEAISNALSHAKYSDTKYEYIETMVVEEDRERMQNELSIPSMLKVFETKDRFSFIFRRALKSGPRYYQIDAGKVYMPGGKTGIVLGFKDIDNEVRKEQAIQKALEEGKKAEKENLRLMKEVQSAAKLAELMGSVSSLLTNMPAMSFSKDARTGVYLACNQAFAEYAHKSSPEGVVGLTDHDIFDKKTADHFVEDDKKAINMDKPYIFFEDVPDAKGNMRNLQTTKTKFEDSLGRLCLLGMCVDVTEMTRIKTLEAINQTKQQELEEKIALQNQLIEQNKLREEQDKMITAMASDYRSIYHLELDSDDIVCYRADPKDNEQHSVGVHFPFYGRFSAYGNKYVDEKYREGFLKFIEPENIRKSLEKEPIISYRYLIRRDGVEYYEMLRMLDVRSQEERKSQTAIHSVGFGFTVIDAEMRETMEKNRVLAEALATAEEASSAKTAFLSNMSHEIRTPMNAIIGLNTLAMRDETLKPETRDYMNKIGNSAKHLLELINDILDMSRIESRRFNLRNEEFSFSNMLEQINTMIMAQCNDKKLTYECKIIGHVDNYYIGDDMRLKQVLINILGNAVKFTEVNGKVTMTIERMSVFDDQSTIKFVVKDTGIGMDKSFLAKIFDSFSQEDSSRNNKYGSTGLGMAITKSIIEKMNGNISVKSEKGTGSEFTVIVTLKNCKHDLNKLKTIDLDKIRILIVDNDGIACEHAKFVLENVGIRADTCKSGKEALEELEIQYAKGESYNLVILDWKMPEMDGMEVAKEIRKRYNEISVIISTAYNWDEISYEAAQIGIDGFLSKPLLPANVLEELDRISRRNNISIFEDKKRTDLKGKHILLAEDIIINAEIVKQILSIKEAETSHAKNGKEVVEMFKNSKLWYYDAILMDVHMPEMDGLEATGEIRKLNRRDAKLVPIIAMTANAFDEDVQLSLQAGMNAHLSKPVEPEHLYQTLEEFIWEAEQHKN